jgi:hypothetical protein
LKSQHLLCKAVHMVVGFFNRALSLLPSFQRVQALLFASTTICIDRLS